MKIGIIDIHGGNIEPGTEEIAKNIAGDNLPIYINNSGKHIESTKFENSELEKFIMDKDIIVSIHGEKDVENSFAMIGGLDLDLKSKIESKLKTNFEVKEPPEILNGNNSDNICNKGKSGKGIQIEISRKLRNELLENTENMRLFTISVRSVLASENTF